MFNSGKLDTTLNDLSLQFLSTILIQLSLFGINPALIHFSQQRHHLGVQHGREQIRLQSRVTKAFLQSVPFDVGALGVGPG
jgi:hypothetical protein